MDKPLNLARKHTGSIVALYKLGTEIASGSRDRTIWVWNIADLSTIKYYIHHHDSVTTLNSWQGNLISGSRDRQIKEYRDENGKDVGKFIFAAHTDWVNVVTASPDGAYMVSGSKDTSLKVWDANWEIAAHCLRHDGPVNDIAWWNRIMISASHDGLCILHKFKK
jgi:hypothetical protein